MTRDVANFLSQGMSRNQARLPVSGVADATQEDVSKTCQEPMERFGEKPMPDKGDLRIDDRLDRIESRLASLQTVLNEIHESALRVSTVKEYYTTHEVAQILKKRPYTVR